jgi:predicted TIM-barrel fold metal-dependent hydrolase
VARTYRIISADSHLDILPERWTPHVPTRWRDRAPRSVKLPNGSDAIVGENRPPMCPGLAITGTPFDQHDPGFVDWEASPGTGSPEQRLREQDQDGVDAEVLFTHPSYPSFWRGIRDDEPYRAMIRAYNTFLAEDYAAAAPDRLFPIGVVPDTGVGDAIEELKQCSDLGLKGVNLHRFPSGKGYPTPDDDRFWAAALDLKMPITAHTNGGTTRFAREGPVFQYARTPGDAGGPGRDPVNLMVRFASENAISPLQMAFAGVFDRFPTLRIYWAETQIGWLPYCLSQVDDNYDRNRYWSERLWGLEPLPRPPSDYLKKHCLWGFMNDPLGIELRHKIGVDRIMWGSDFAHASSDWPHSREMLESTFVGVPEEERARILVKNAREFFGL